MSRADERAHTVREHVKAIEAHLVLPEPRPPFLPDQWPDEPPDEPPPPPPPPRGNWMFAHMPVPSLEALQSRPWADGPALYGAQGVDFGVSRLAPYIGRGQPMPIYAMPKTMSDASIAAVRAGLTDAELALLWLTKGQEPEEDKGMQTEAAQKAFRADAVRYMDRFDGSGAHIGLHLQCWTTNPNNHSATSGAAHLRKFMPGPMWPEEARVPDFVGCTLLDHHQHPTARFQLEPFIKAVRETEGYKDVPIMVTSAGFSIPAFGATDQQVRDRGEATADFFAVVNELLPGQPVGWFDMRYPFEDPETDNVVATDPLLPGIFTNEHDARAPKGRV